MIARGHIGRDIRKCVTCNHHHCGICRVKKQPSCHRCDCHTYRPKKGWDVIDEGPRKEVDAKPRRSKARRG